MQRESRKCDSVRVALAKKDALVTDLIENNLKMFADFNAEREKKEAVERAKQAEIDRQAEKQRKADAEQAKLEANKKHVGDIRKAAKESLISLGIGEETARKIVLAISHGRISNITINY